MTALDDRLPAAIAAMIDRLGVTASYRQLFDYGYDPSDGTVSQGGTGSDDTYSVTASPPVPVSRDWVATGFAKEGSSVIYVAGQDTDGVVLTFTPKQGDTITIGSETWRIEAMQRYLSGDSTAAWQFVVRGGTA